MEERVVDGARRGSVGCEADGRLGQWRRFGHARADMGRLWLSYLDRGIYLVGKSLGKAARLMKVR
jgi:hypothetical protein